MDEGKKAKYDGMDILSLEAQAENVWKKSREEQKEMIEILIYLKTTGRWKENKAYEKQSFFTYLDDRFHIRMGTFYEMQRAFVKFPEETVKHGIGLIAKIERICGPKNEKLALQEIEKTGQQKPLNRNQIERIIQKHKDPERARKAKEHKDWKALYEREATAHEKTREALKAAMAKVKELEEQNEKLKRTASLVSALRRTMEQHKEKMATI